MRPDNSKSTLGESFFCALQGIVVVSRSRNFRIEVAFALVAVLLGIALGNTLSEWLAVSVCIGVVLAAECINTALEDTVDLACSDWHPLAKRAKDAAAGGVLIASAASLVVGVAIYAPALASLALGG